MSTLSISPVFTAPSALRAARRPQSTVRLTRRGRAVVFLASLALALVAAFFLGAVAVGSETPGEAAPTEIVMVGSGETLWGIAAELETGDDIRTTMREIERLNALESAQLFAGQKLRVPVSDS
ncbi:LysM peptidoglycan-binding domain-containing protein [Nocardioides piscis]|uniref:LysM peptidoglycan-binding domain-containing protein n=1 Tax=Nocardioides piscis TaxID=2714938 RepID=A0A6G7YCG4_9ACTN|nr:LysM peptidoglycan-binding domain-containing protein [Nocardioides piscis]QIK74366.1 LysM peptidoglycan-binding domain-containing protein [Nocardioides piscis]